MQTCKRDAISRTVKLLELLEILDSLYYSVAQLMLTTSLFFVAHIESLTYQQEFLIQNQLLCPGDLIQSLVQAAMSQLNLSARAYHRILKLSRTIADLAGSEEIQSTHLAEVMQYRPKLMMG